MYTKIVSQISAGSKSATFPVLLKVTKGGLNPLKSEVRPPWIGEDGVYALNHARIQSMLQEETHWEDSLQDSSGLGLALSDQGIKALFISAGLYKETIERILKKCVEGSIEPNQSYRQGLIKYDLENGERVFDFEVLIERVPAWLLQISGGHTAGKIKPHIIGTLDYLQETLPTTLFPVEGISKSLRAEIFMTLVQAVKAGGRAIMEIHKRDDFITFTKSGVEVADEKARKEISKKYTTEADLASHKAIAQVLGETDFHGIPIIYEESDWPRIQQGTYISVDEMDGTGRFIKRKPGFMVLTQYVENGQPPIGVNYDPVNNNLFYALRGEGSFINSEDNRIDLRGSSVDLETARVIVNGRDKERPENANYWKFMLDKFGDRLTAGLATGSRIAGILKGNFDIFVNNGSEELQIWDLGMVLNLREAGGMATRKDGSELDFTKPGIIGDIVCSANPKLHEQMLKFLQGYNK